MSREAYSPPDPENWRAVVLKLILFPMTQMEQHEKREWWKEITGKEPDESSRKKDTLQESGTIGTDRSLTVRVDPVRIEVSLRTPFDDESQMQLGDFVEEQEKFLDLLEPWLPGVLPINRIGVASNSWYPVPDREEGYRLLNRFLRTVEIDSESTDFMYRVNRPTTSKKKNGVVLNRLMTWRVLRAATVLLTLSDKEQKAQAVGKDVFCVVLDLDINTTTQAEPIESASVVPLCRELSALGIEIASKGDVGAGQ